MARSLTGTRIRERRRSKNLSQTELARKVGISPSYLNLIEHNRRGIAGKTLLNIAELLGIDARTLAEGADRALIVSLQEAAAANSDTDIEIARLEEFIGRFPGWAALVGKLHSHSRFQHETLLALSDRLNHDPFFAEAIHMMLSNITAIHSTAGILADAGEIPDLTRRMFLDNLSAESDRLARTAQDVIRHFDMATDPEQITTRTSAVDRFFETHGYYLEALETGAATPEDFAPTADADADYEAAELRRTLDGYAAMARDLPLDPFLQTCRDLRFDPLAIAAALSRPLDSVLRRLAHLPARADVPEFGFLEVDAAGGVLFRKELKSLSLPRFSSGCPLWPVYRTLGQPGLPLRAMMSTPTGESYLSYSLARQEPSATFGLPPRLTGMMIFTMDYQAQLDRAEQKALPSLDVGFHCTVCPRKNCSARRGAYILNRTGSGRDD